MMSQIDKFGDKMEIGDCKELDGEIGRGRFTGIRFCFGTMKHFGTR